MYESKEVALPKGVGGALRVVLDDDARSAVLKVKSSKVGLIAGELTGEGWRSDGRAVLKGTKGEVKAELAVKKGGDGKPVNAVLTIRVNALEVPLSFRLEQTDGDGEDDGEDDDEGGEGVFKRALKWVGDNPFLSAGGAGAIALAVMKFRK